MVKKFRPAVEQLEDRLTPANLGLPWVDPRHLTLSFAPDGTMAGGSANVLNSTLDAQVPTGSWRLEILRAFQTWAVNSNINIGVVNDFGLPMGTAGLAQGDSRFGDIRVMAQQLSPEVVATGNAFQLNGSTLSGDVLLNTVYSFGIGDPNTYDLFSILLPEAGHTFGLADSTDPASVLYRSYAGIRTGLSSGDIAAIQGLYGGARQADSFDAKSVNNSLATASSLGSLTSLVTGDITTLDDADFYKFSVPNTLLTAAPTVYVQLRVSGISLLTPSLTVYDNAGNAVGSAVSSGPMTGDLAVAISSASGSNSYYVRVGNATQSVFGIGSYQLALSTQPVPPPPPPGAFVSVDNHKDDTLGSANKLTARNSTPTRLDYSTQASISDPLDVDFYKFHSPATVNNATQELVVLVSANELNALDARVDVYDASNNLVASQVIGNAAGFFSVQIPDALSDKDYFAKVSAIYPTGRHAVGNYFFGADFSLIPTVSVQNWTGGTLTGLNPQQSQTLVVNRASALEFILSADAGTSTSSAEVQMKIFDQNGNLVFGLVAVAGKSATTGVAYLGAGTYTVRYVVVSRDPFLTPSVTYNLKGIQISNAIGPTLVDSSGTGGNSTPPPPDYFWYDANYLALAITYGWIDPFYY